MTGTGYFRHLWSRFRREPKAQLALDGLGRIGISIQPFFLFEEFLPPGGPPPVDASLQRAEMRLLGPDDMAAVAAVPWRGLDIDLFLQRLAQGSGCCGLYDGGELAAFTWFDPNECNYEGWRFPLRPGEAYLYDAYTLPAWRGRGLAPLLRYRAYEILAAQGRTRFFSISLRTNRAAVRFKQKLGGRIVGRGYSVALFGRWRFGSRPPARTDSA